MNPAELLTLLNYGLVFVFGALLSAHICGGCSSRSEGLRLGAMILALLAVQVIFSHFFGLSAAEKCYPLITHLPLILGLWLFLKRPFLISSVSVLIAYLFCQIPNWIRYAILYFSGSALISEAGYTAVIVLSYVLIRCFLTGPACEAVHDSRQSLQFLGLLPVLYYVFDYAVTVYTRILYQGIPVISEFIPTMTVIAYIFFVALYPREIRRRYATELENSVLTIKLQQSDEELAVLQRSLDETAAYRHDMRHHFMILGEYIKNGDTEKALEYIHTAQSDLNRLTPKQYCKNPSANLILSHYAAAAAQSGIRYQVDANIPETLQLSETELCTLLSNAIENAVHAASRCRPDHRWVSVRFSLRKKNLLISVENSFEGEVRFENGLPVSDRPGHGLGVRSIRNIIEGHNGIFSFDAGEGVFTLRVILNLS